MSDSRRIVKVKFVTRKKRAGDVESGAQREEIKRGSGERNGRRERRCQKRKVRGGGVSEDREDDKTSGRGSRHLARAQEITIYGRLGIS